MSGLPVLPVSSCPSRSSGGGERRLLREALEEEALEEEARLVVTEEGEHPIHESRWFVVAKVRVIDEHTCRMV